MFFTLGCVAWLHGCNGYSPDDVPRGGIGAASAPADGRAELSRIADRYMATSTPGSAAYKVGPMDVLDITVFGVPELTKSAQVSESGTINLPLLGDVAISGKTPNQVEHDLQARLNGKYLKSAHVSVFVKEYNNSRVTVMGSVKTPGVQPLRGATTLMQVIAQAGGADRDNASTNVVVFQNIDGQRAASRYDLAEIHAGRSPDPQIQAGDVIVIEDSTLKTSWNVVRQVLPFSSAGTAILLGL